MAGHGDEAEAVAADGPRRGGAADLRHGAIHHAGVLVEDDDLRFGQRLGQQPGQRDAELLAGGQDGENPFP